MNNDKLKIGLLLDGYSVAAWELQMINNILSSNSTEISLVVLNENIKNKPIRKGVERLKHSYKRIPKVLINRALDYSYKKLIQRGTLISDAQLNVSCSEILASVPALSVRTRRTKLSDHFNQEDLDEISTFKIDVFVRCGFGILRGGILSAAKYGVWSFHHGDNRKNRGGPPGYWESMEDWPETGSILQILTEDLDNGKVLYRSYSCTNNMSVDDNRSNYYWKSLSFMMRKLHELHRIGGDKFIENVKLDNQHPEIYSNRLYTQPSNYEQAKLLAQNIVRKIKLIVSNKLFYDQWILMFHINPEFSSSLWRYKKMIPPKEVFWADPHVILKDKTYYIFIEEYRYDIEKAHISVIEMDEKGSYGEPKIILDKPYHLSYPFVLEHEGDYYMIPESSENGTIELYKCVDFPGKWEFEMNLMENVNAVDATVFYHKNKWRMLVNMIENEGASSSDELFLFSSKELLSSHWEPHISNPVVSDCKSARPAGNVFYQNSKLYRPSQNCSVRYGYGFNLCEIQQLDENSYQESIVSRVTPNWDKKIVATHTFNRVGNLHIIDAIQTRRL